MIHGDMGEASKPPPDIFATALEEVGLDPERTMVVSDTRWDLEAASARRPQVCGRAHRRHDPAPTWRTPGAVAVDEDVADLLDHLDDSPLATLLER